MRKVLRDVRRVAAVVVTGLLVTTLVAVAGMFWLVQQEGWLFQSVATGSMEPTIPTGSVILSRPVDAEDVRVGDVIVFASPTGGTVVGGDDGVFAADEQMLITHRVVAIDRGDGIAFRTKGDGNEAEDPWLVTPEMVRARFLGHVPVLGTVVSRPDLRRWLYLAVAAAGAVVIVAEARSMVRELRKPPDADVGTADSDPESAGDADVVTIPGVPSMEGSST